MRPTVEYVNTKFEEFNRLCFEGKLPPIPVAVTQAKSYLGKVVFKKNTGFLKKTKYSDFRMLISNRRDLDSDVVDDTILHEMIHYWILFNGIRDTSTHGEVFRRMMHDFNRRFGRKVTVSHRVTKEEMERNRERKSNLVCISRLKDGSYGITVAARTRILELWDGLEAWDLVERSRWIFTEHPFFGNYPRSMKTKLYRVAPEELKKALDGARILQRNGKKIYVTPNIFNLLCLEK